MSQGRARLIKSVTLMMIAALLGKMLYIVREPIVAAYFGLGEQTDAYNVALAIVTMFLSITISPIGDVFVPVYTERLHKDRAAGERFARQSLTLYLLILSSALLIAYLAAPWLVHAYAPGFSPEATTLATHLTRILGLFALVSGLVGYFEMVLTAHQEFLWVALGPVITAVLVIAVLIATVPHLGIDALAWGMVAGNAVQALLLALSTVRRRVSLGLNFHLGDAVRSLGRLSGWVVVGRFVGQGNELIDRNMLSYLSTGSIAALGFARSVYLLPFTIFTTGITRVIIADFSWDMAQGDTAALKRDLALAIRMAAFFMIPVTVGFMVLRSPMVRILYQRGQFGVADAEATATVLAFLALGLFFRAVVFIVGRAFVAIQDTATRAWISMASFVVHLGLNLILVPTWGLYGIALSLSITEAFAAGAFVAGLRWRTGRLGLLSLLKPLTIMAVAASLMGLLLFAAVEVLPVQANLVVQVVALAMEVGIGGLVYLGVAYLLRLPDLQTFWRMLRQGLRAGALQRGTKIEQ